MEELPDAMNQLEARVVALEQRVCALEHASGAAELVPVQLSGAEPAAQDSGQFSGSITTGALSLLGKAMLGIAGAYLLRAVAESDALPRTAMAAVAIAYALAWLFWASRTKAADWLAGTIYSCTSGLILAPMLWELTLRFDVLPAPVTAGVVTVFVIAASALEWKRASGPVVWVSFATAAATSLALAIATHKMIPFEAALLVMVLIAEYRAVANRESGVRALAALAADFGIWALIYVYAGPQNSRIDYPAINAAMLIAPGVLLFLISGGSVMLRAVMKRTRITAFETIQTTIAFLLAACSLIYFGPHSSAVGLGVFSLVASAGCYAAAYLRFDPVLERRNSLVFATWSVVLFAAGSIMCVPPWLQVSWLGIAAIAATAWGTRLGRHLLELHGLAFLLLASVVAGLFQNAWGALAGTMPSGAHWAIWLVVIGAVVCYLMAASRPGDGAGMRIVAALFALLGCLGATALLVQGLVSATAVWLVPGPHHVAFIRTLTVCVVAIAMAFGGSRWQRVELTRIAYGLLGLVAVKMVFEDLRHGHLAYVAGSIFLFAVALIAVPRLVRAGQRPLRNP